MRLLPRPSAALCAETFSRFHGLDTPRCTERFHARRIGARGRPHPAATTSGAVGDRAHPSSPRPKGLSEVAQEPTKRRIRSCRPVKVHVRHEFLREFDAAKGRRGSRGMDGVDQLPLVAVSLALLVRGFAALAKDLLERRSIEKQPALHMRIRDCPHDLNACLCAADLLRARSVPLAVSVGGNDNEARRGRSLPVDVNQVLLESLANSSMTTDSAAPFHPNLDADLVRNSLHQCANHLLMSRVFHKQRNSMRQSRLS